MRPVNLQRVQLWPTRDWQTVCVSYSSASTCEELRLCRALKNSSKINYFCICRLLNLLVKFTQFLSKYKFIKCKNFWYIKQRNLKSDWLITRRARLSFPVSRRVSFVFIFFKDFIWRKMIELLFNIFMVEFLCWTDLKKLGEGDAVQCTFYLISEKSVW